MPFVAAKSPVRFLSKHSSHAHFYTLSEFADEVEKECRRVASEADRMAHRYNDSTESADLKSTAVS